MAGRLRGLEAIENNAGRLSNMPMAKANRSIAHLLSAKVAA